VSNQRLYRPSPGATIAPGKVWKGEFKNRPSSTPNLSLCLKLQGVICVKARFCETSVVFVGNLLLSASVLRPVWILFPQTEQAASRLA